VPLYDDAIDKIIFNLMQIEKGERAQFLEVGEFTDVQFAMINDLRTQRRLFLLEENKILFVGRHLHQSRSRNGYTIEDMADQLISAMSDSSVAMFDKHLSALKNESPRPDRYGNLVKDMAVFEMAAKKPKAELFSVIPKGDSKPPK